MTTTPLSIFETTDEGANSVNVNFDRWSVTLDRASYTGELLQMTVTDWDNGWPRPLQLEYGALRHELTFDEVESLAWAMMAAVKAERDRHSRPYSTTR